MHQPQIRNLKGTYIVDRQNTRYAYYRGGPSIAVTAAMHVSWPKDCNHLASMSRSYYYKRWLSPARLHVLTVSLAALRKFDRSHSLLSQLCLRSLLCPRALYQQSTRYYIIWLTRYRSESSIQTTVDRSQSKVLQSHDIAHSHLSHPMDASYQAGQSSQSPRRPDLKKKLVVVGDGARG